MGDNRRRGGVFVIFEKYIYILILLPSLPESCLPSPELLTTSLCKSTLYMKITYIDRLLIKIFMILGQYKVSKGVCNVVKII